MGAWIETLQLNLLLQLRNVAPRVGAWIETANKLKNGSPIFGSHLVWVRGLKLLVPRMLINISLVAPRVGAWIETLIIYLENMNVAIVAPRVGAWIETKHTKGVTLVVVASHLVWVRGLKPR